MCVVDLLNSAPVISHTGALWRRRACYIIFIMIMIIILQRVMEWLYYGLFATRWKNLLSVKEIKWNNTMDWKLFGKTRNTVSGSALCFSWNFQNITLYQLLHLTCTMLLGEICVCCPQFLVETTLPPDKLVLPCKRKVLYALLLIIHLLLNLQLQITYKPKRFYATFHTKRPKSIFL